jgi:hypothetical protein
MSGVPAQFLHYLVGERTIRRPDGRRPCRLRPQPPRASPGWGDDEYMTYIGCTERQTVARVVTDVMVL